MAAAERGPCLSQPSAVPTQVGKLLVSGPWVLLWIVTDSFCLDSEWQGSARNQGESDDPMPVHVQTSEVGSGML